MNLAAYKEAFQVSHHSPGVGRLRSILANDVTDFCVPVNIGFPPPAFMTEIHDQLLDRLKYYPSEPGPLREKFGAFVGVSGASLVAGNGSTELFYNLLSASPKKRRIVTCVPTFGRWTDAPRAAGHTVIGYHRREENKFAIMADEFCKLARLHSADTVMISNPNNPTGHLTTRLELLHLIERLRSTAPTVDLIVIDESFLDFSPRRDLTTLIRDVEHLDRVVVLKSLGKSFGLHGTRMGVLVAAPSTIGELENYVPYWNVNGVAENVIDLMPKYRAEFRRSLDVTVEATANMMTRLNLIKGITTFATDANYVYFKLDDHFDPIKLRDFLLIKHGLFVRSCGNKEGGSSHHFRIATRESHDVERLAGAIESFL